MSDISQRISQWNAWKLINLGERVDSFNFHETKSFFDSLVKPGALIVIEVKQTKFLSLATYKYLADLAKHLKQQNGQLAFFGATEKLKVQMGLLSSTENILLVKHLEHLPIYSQNLNLAHANRDMGI